PPTRPIATPATWRGRCSPAASRAARPDGRLLQPPPRDADVDRATHEPGVELVAGRVGKGLLLPVRRSERAEQLGRDQEVLAERQGGSRAHTRAEARVLEGPGDGSLHRAEGPARPDERVG